MSDIEWGSPIEVNGVRPEWLRRSDAVAGGIKTSAGWVGVGADDPNCAAVEDWYWDVITAIRLPADHPYYLATSRGFTYWPGGERAPEDWDGGEVLWGDGEIQRAGKWDRGYPDYLTVIGYRRRAEQPAPAIAPELVERMAAFVRECAAVVNVNSFALVDSIRDDANEILAELEPADPDMTLAKSIYGDVEAIAAAIKAARENGR